SAGTGQTTFVANYAFNNTGTLDVQSGTMTLNGPHNLTGGTINIGISSVSNFGKVILSGAAGFTGSFSANLNGGYIPITNNSFEVITYGSLSGNFTNVTLPFADAWTTNYAPTVFSIQVLNTRPIPPSLTNQIVSELTTLTVTNIAIDLDVPTNTLAYALLDAPIGASINSGGVISWTPSEEQGPSTNVITTVVTDTGTPVLKATNSFSVDVNEVNVPPVFPVHTNLGVLELTLLTVTNTATDSDVPINALTYLLLDAPSGAVMDTNGVITWTPDETQGPNTNTFVTVVTDNNPHAINTQQFSVTNTFEVVVYEVNVAPVLTTPTSTNIIELVMYSASATATDEDIPNNALTFALVSGPTGLTVSPSGAINWTPDETQGPNTNLVVIQVTDQSPDAANATSLSTTNYFTLIVNEVNVAPIVGALTNLTVNPGESINIPLTATDADVPVNTLFFSLQSPPAGAFIPVVLNRFLWRPSATQADTTNIIVVIARDNGSPNLSGTNSFTVVVNPLAPVVLTPISHTNGHFIFSVSGSAGPDYIIQASTNLATWAGIFTNFSAVPPFQFNDTNALQFPNRNYRVRLFP
ncbi:MAG: hypothetical protein H7Y43_10120, partial [Akkermansiaceae bacterium]|nr:hypothetical protein [Verrucomicrobiales bacterium]